MSKRKTTLLAPLGYYYEPRDSPHIKKIHNRLKGRIVSHIRDTTVYFTDGSRLHFEIVQGHCGPTGDVKSEVLRWK